MVVFKTKLVRHSKSKGVHMNELQVVIYESKFSIAIAEQLIKDAKQLLQRSK